MPISRFDRVRNCAYLSCEYIVALRNEETNLTSEAVNSNGYEIVPEIKEYAPNCSWKI